MDLREYNPDPALIAEVKDYMEYQPYILSDDFQVGIAHDWLYRSGTMKMDRSQVSAKDWKAFSKANARLRAMYNDWIDMVWDVVYPETPNPTVLDMAGNAGFFLYRFLEKGASRCIGYDLNPKFGHTYKLLNQIIGVNAEFVHSPYNEMTHEIPGAEQADIVISSAIMCHLSDPTYLLAYLGSLTKKALLLFTAVDDSSALKITYSKPGAFDHMKNPPERRFPACFDNMTSISRPLLALGFEAVGFKQVIEIEHRRKWLPSSYLNRHNLRAFLAIK